MHHLGPLQVTVEFHALRVGLITDVLGEVVDWGAEGYGGAGVVGAGVGGED